jgi:uncharacterized protein YdhG (YjbR/CyaY superfamily)
MQSRVKNIDSYIALQPVEAREGLEKLRQIILSVAPDAEELISYNMPAFKYHGMLVGFLNCKNHYGFYPWNGSIIAVFKEALKTYKTSPGAIQFPKDRPLPMALIKKIVKTRMKENRATCIIKKQLLGKK